MKVRVLDPVTAAKETGGCTYEPWGCGENGIVGWWTYTTNPEIAHRIGQVFNGTRDAIFLPTIQKNGDVVSREIVEQLKVRARLLGLKEVSQASGMWVLGNDESIPHELRGTVQSETIWIFWSQNQIDCAALAQLAEEMVTLCNQDSIAYEIAGELNFVG